MGIYVNPGNKQFNEDVHRPIYVDKSGLLTFTNLAFTDRAKTRICVSRPRRFGKSMAINMLTAYYSKGCDSRELFLNLKIAGDPSFEQHLNRHNVIRLDIQSMVIGANSPCNSMDPLEYIETSVIKELRKIFPESLPQENYSLYEALLQITSKANEKFIFLLDEWDVIYREDRYASIRDAYTQWLKALFKGSDTARCIDFVYLTGILPIPPQNSQSALNNFREYTMRDPRDLSPYTGFTDPEVRELCKKHKMSYKKIRARYNGYTFPGVRSAYCPYSVVLALEHHSVEDYWAETASNAEILEAYRSELPGVREAVRLLLSGERVEISQSCFQLDEEGPVTAGEILAQMVHLGYLSYNKSTQTASIANMEVRDIFLDKLKRLPEEIKLSFVGETQDTADNTTSASA